MSVVDDEGELVGGEGGKTCGGGGWGVSPVKKNSNISWGWKTIFVLLGRADNPRCRRCRGERLS